MGMDDEPTFSTGAAGDEGASAARWPHPAAELVRANRELWDGWTELHVPSEFYDVEGFKQGRDTLDAVELDGVLGAVGEIRGKSLLHLQCHFGLDTLSWARRGARVTGVDFSEKAVAHARRLAGELGLEARFLLADVTDTEAVVTALGGERFDVVFTSHGVISWLPDLRPWARTIAAAPSPGRHVLPRRLPPLLLDVRRRGRPARTAGAF